ncbi:hypothetical protein AB0454_23035 [Streptomyces sp. NPDC093509]|uniref:hypothetical protein n=1 Tax=Streptomyces sp. NPDC093509 TaxID=3154982 RepID=UPI00344F7F2A
MAPEFPQEHVDAIPYGKSQQAVKPGLTPRGKVVLAFGAAALATTGLVGYQAYSANAAESAVKAQEIAYKKDLLELEKLKVQTQVNKTQASTVSARQKHIDACVADSKDLVGKSLNSSYRDIVEACQAQYTGDESPSMETAASASDSSGGINNGVLVVGGIGVIGVIILVQRARRSHAV